MSKGLKFQDMSEIQKDILVSNLSVFMGWFERTFKVDVYLAYGTLLGAMRERDFIATDNDIDLCYLSSKNNINDVFLEMLEIYESCEKLNILLSRGQGSGYPRNCGHAHICLPGTDNVYDMWTSWIDEKGKYNFWSMGMDLKRGVLLPFSEAQLRGYTLKVPHKSKEVLSYLYTERWKIPENRKSYYYRKTYLKSLTELIDQEA